MKGLPCREQPSVLLPGETQNRPGLWEPQAVRAVACRRLADYIEQHAKDAAVVAAGLTAHP